MIITFILFLIIADILYIFNLEIQIVHQAVKSYLVDQILKNILVPLLMFPLPDKVTGNLALMSMY